MIALITSTLIPNKNSYSFFSNEERIKQTEVTINKLLELAFDSIYIFDNSDEKTDINTISPLFSKNSNIKFYHNDQYAFKNKGMNEALLILNNIKELPSDQAIFKISARYYPNKHFIISAFDDFLTYDFVGIGYNFFQKGGTVSTRAYAVKNSIILEKILLLAIEDMLSYSSKPRGVRSIFNLISNYFKETIGASFQLSIEHSYARILKKEYRYKSLNALNIEGYIAGNKTKELISE
jgi:hypothetical protein